MGGEEEEVVLGPAAAYSAAVAEWLNQAYHAQMIQVPHHAVPYRANDHLVEVAVEHFLPEILHRLPSRILFHTTGNVSHKNVNKYRYGIFCYFTVIFYASGPSKRWSIGFNTIMVTVPR